MENILIRPIITEKASADAEGSNRYHFVVRRDANKVEIKKAVESFYGVSVEAVRTQVVAARRQSRYTRAGMIEGSKSAYKKAIVEVREGEMIDIYSNI
ncbi:MAG: 50S ribosomal protein L23 [Flavobacteriia bacterium]|nr:50S ribosomal protein L23 [Flavobacteriia bacterium]